MAKFYTVVWESRYRVGSEDFVSFGTAYRFYVRKAQEGCGVELTGDGAVMDGEGLTDHERGHLLPDHAELKAAGPSESVSRAVNGSGVS